MESTRTSEMRGQESESKHSLHQSAKMREAQKYFQQVVKHELHSLLCQNIERDVAVQQLLRRIVHSTEEPPKADVKRVMRQFQMNYEDAMRALIVKQEIGRLKKMGLDAFAAIEELTRKMQRSDSHMKGTSSERSEIEEQGSDSTEEKIQVDNTRKGSTSSDAEPKVETMDELKETQLPSSPDTNNQFLSSLSKRIGNVSISSAHTDSSKTPPRKTWASTSRHSKKRKNPPSTIHETPETEREDKLQRSPPSPTARFASDRKKQKLRVSVNDNFIQVLPTPKKPSMDKEPVNALKRQRSEEDSPISDLDEEDTHAVVAAAPLLRQPKLKRHRTGV